VSSKPIAVIVLGPGGLETAQVLCEAFPGAQLHGLASCVPRADVPFTDTMGHLRDLFSAGTPIVGICAAGILIRAVAPLLLDKREEPPVVAVAETGDGIVPLLGGHHGANDLARLAARALGGVAAITTAGDARFGLALDEPPVGWQVFNADRAKAVTAALLAGGPVGLIVESGDAGWLTESGAPFAEFGSPVVRVSHRAAAIDATDLILHPPVLALGVGCERNVPVDDLAAHVETVLASAGLSAGAIACICSVDLKADEPAVLALAQRLGVPARFFPAAELEELALRLANPSEIVFQEVGCHGVSEGAALAAAGEGSTLVVEKQTGARVTCAVALASGNIDAATVGMPRGRLAIVGIGPGDAGWRTPEATRMIAESGHVVGYGLYLDLLGNLLAGKTRHDRALSEEEARCRLALDLAARGEQVALVCSGDAGIYALATLVLELLDREDRGDWNRLEIMVSPGVSALQAAAARLGAPLGHDFCAISLSDLLTPWLAIEGRLRAAAEGDFVVALYNPVSRRRRKQLECARDILLAHRPADTPVALARNLGRKGETIRTIRLGDLIADEVDMLTIVLIGNRQTCTTRRGQRDWLYTPRGYCISEQKD